MKPGPVFLIDQRRDRDIAYCADIWLAASIAGHAFIPEAFWQGQHQAMCDRYLPQARIRLACMGGEILGFSAMRERTLEALFVLPAHWSKGIGTLLLRDVMGGSTTVKLAAYAQNKRAIDFYTRAGFVPGHTDRCPNTGEQQIHFSWQRGAAK